MRPVERMRRTLEKLGKIKMSNTNIFETMDSFPIRSQSLEAEFTQQFPINLCESMSRIHAKFNENEQLTTENGPDHS
jgi:hypothetical protein